MTDPSSPSATHVRWWVVGLATGMAVLLYLDRICLSICVPYIAEDLGLTNEQASWLLSAFFWTYALGQVPSGWLSDRFGARRMLALYILGWSLFTGVMGVLGGFLALLLFRAGCGLTQAGAYPTSANLISKWVPFATRGAASGLVSTGGRIGGFAAPVLTAYLMVAFVPTEERSLLVPEDILDAPGLVQQLKQTETTPAARLADVLRPRLSAPTKDPEALAAALNEVVRQRDLYQHVNLEEFSLPKEALRLAAIPDEQLSNRQIDRRNRLLLEVAFHEQVRKIYVRGWRPVMLVYGLVGVVVAGLFWVLVRDRPQAHPACNAAEVELIESGRPATATSPHGQVRELPLRYLLQNRSLWCSSVSQFGTNFGWVFLITLLPRYLDKVHHVPINELGWMASLPLWIGMSGMLSGGWLTDVLTRRMGLRWGRCLPMVLTRFVVMAAFLSCLLLNSPWPVVAALCVVAIGTDLGTPSVWAFMQDVGGRHVGSVLGWGNMWGNLGAALSPPLLNLVVKHGGWEACFVACAGAFLVSGVAALGVDARIPIVPREP